MLFQRLIPNRGDRMNSHRPEWTAIALGLICTCLSLGCQPQIDLVPLQGQVSYRSELLEYGSVMFQPVGGGPLARGQIQADGSFQLTTLDEGDGVQSGPCRVRITAFDAQKPDAMAKGKGEMTLGKSAIPMKYQSFRSSGINIEVTPDLPQPVSIDLE
ncbi:MAG: hypothetical protein MK171_12815 [Pirellulales bacterium]|nr:hypothetical protein [Pirellulales bacterium]